MVLGRRHDTEELLLEHAERFEREPLSLESTLARTTLPVFVHDGAEIIIANSAAASWLGYEHAGALPGRGLGCLAQEEDRVSLLATVGATSAGPPHEAHLQRFRTAKDGVVLGEALARRVGGPREPRVVVVIQPTGAAHRSSDHLRLLEAALDHMRDIVFVTEAEPIDALGRRVVFVNRAFCRVTGFEPDDVLGKTPNVTVGEATDRAVLTRIEGRLRKHLPVREELEKYGKDGTRYWVELDIIPLFDEQGRHSHWVSVQRDVTERKRLHAELAGVERRASRLGGEDVEPLSNAMENLESIAQRMLDPHRAGRLDARALSDELANVRRGLEQAQTNAQRARAILRQLAVLADDPSKARRDVDARLIFDHAVEEVLGEVASGVEVVRHFEVVPPVRVFPEQLAQVLYGLVLDGLHAVDPRFSELSTLFLRVKPGGDHVLCEVEVSGPGAASPGRSNPKAPGTELGLLVARSMVRGMGGELSHHPNPGTGTLHRLRLPLTARARVRNESAERVSPRVRGARVLVVEPDARHAQELRRLLAAVDHVVLESSVDAALARLASAEGYEIVFCDLTTLGQGARELYRAAGDRSAELLRRFVFTHDGALPPGLEAFLSASTRPHVEKPFDVDEVRSVLSTVLYSDIPPVRLD